VQLVLLFFVARPAIKAFRDGNAEARGRIMMVTGISHLLLVVMLYLMIFKPGLSA
jgi:type II secretory pathway component PulM